MIDVMNKKTKIVASLMLVSIRFYIRLIKTLLLQTVAVMTRDFLYEPFCPIGTNIQLKFLLRGGFGLESGETPIKSTAVHMSNGTQNSPLANKMD